MAEWWLSCERMTVWAKDDDGIVVATAPITRKFLGQPLSALAAWLRGLGGFQWAELVETEGAS